MNAFPFDSVVSFDADGIPHYDRPYDAAALRTALKAFFSTGVFYQNSDSLRVEAPPNDTMTININPGQCHIEGVVGNETQMRSLEIEAADTTYPRIDRVIARLNDNQAARNMDLYILKGTPATLPVPAEPVRTGAIYDLVLADVYIVPNATRIGADRITDQRLNPDVCGIVTSNPQTVDTASLYTQFQGALDAYLELVDQAIEGTIAGDLQAQIDDLKTRMDIAESNITQLQEDTAISDVTIDLYKALGFDPAASGGGV